MKGADLSMKKEEEVFVLEVEGYVTCVSALLRLIEVQGVRPTTSHTRS